MAATHQRRQLRAAEQGQQALRLQHGFDVISLMPTNLYGPGDNYHPMYSHVLPALIRRFHEATQTGATSLTCWGTGAPMRELAEAVAEATGYTGKILWDSSKPDATPKKQLDVNRLQAMGWTARIPLSEGLANAVEDFVTNTASLRL